MKQVASVVALTLLWLQQGTVSGASPTRSLTVADSIETTRALYGFDYRSAVRVSPDGSRYLLILYRADLERNGNWVEFFSGTTESLAAAARGDYVARLFTSDHDALHLLATPVIWLDDNARVALVWNDGKNRGQVTTVNLKTHQVETLTHHPQGVSHFDITPDGATLIYTAVTAAQDYKPRFGPEMSPRFQEMLRNGFAVPDSAFTVTALLNGYADDRARGFYSHEIFVASASKKYAPRKVAINGYTLPPVLPRLSPDGHWAIVAAPPVMLRDEWDRYTASDIRSSLAIAKRSPDQPNTLRQLWLVNTSDAQARPLWNVPYAGPPPVTWSADSRSILVSRTLLPVGQADASGLGRAIAAEVDIHTTHAVKQNDTNASRARRRFEYIEGEWRAVSPRKAARRQRTAGQVHIELREDPNTPPALFAMEPASGRELMILDLNPKLRTDFKLGRVQLVHWRDGDGRAWSARLYYPVDYIPQRRFPLVILTAPSSATAPNQFSLRGSELTASVLSIAQPLANRNIAALVMAHPDDPKAIKVASPREGEVVTAGYESAIDYLAASGLVACDRVGLIGYSRTGYYVQYAITHSPFPFAAAISADNVTFSYLQYVLEIGTWGRAEFEQVNGAIPVGDGLEGWLQRAPGFNAHKVRTPLRMEINNGGITGLIGQWELFSQLRYLGKPVELYVIPDIERGSHGLMLPTQQMASLNGALEWMDFWLNGRESSDPSKVEQYARWRNLRVLRDAGQRDR